MPDSPGLAPPGPDPALLHRVMAERGVVAGDPEAGWLAWARAAADHEWQRLLAMLDLPVGWEWGGAVVLGLVAVALVQFLLWAWRRPRAGAPEQPAGVGRVEGDEDCVFSLDVATALLAAGQRREAARHGWLWMAERISRRGVGVVNAEQTHGDFVRTVDPGWPAHRDLGQLAGVADRLCYAAEEPSVEAVTVWFVRVQAFSGEGE